MMKSAVLLLTSANVCDAISAGALPVNMDFPQLQQYVNRMPVDNIPHTVYKNVLAPGESFTPGRPVLLCDDVLNRVHYLLERGVKFQDSMGSFPQLYQIRRGPANDLKYRHGNNLLLTHENLHKYFAKKMDKNQAFDWKHYGDEMPKKYLPWKSRDYVMPDGRKPFNLKSWHARTTKNDTPIIQEMMESNNHIALQHIFDAAEEQIGDTASTQMTLSDLEANITQRENTPLNAKLGAVSKRFGALRLIQDNTTKELPQGTGLNALDANVFDVIASHAEQKLHPELRYIAKWARSVQNNHKINQSTKDLVLSQKICHVFPFLSTLLPVEDKSDTFMQRTNPAYLPKECSDHCQSCNEKFRFYRWRHHCKSCGALVCDDCSKHELSLRKNKYLTNDPENYTEKQRVCDGCFNRLH